MPAGSPFMTSAIWATPAPWLFLIIKRSQEKGISWKELADTFIDEFYTDMDRLQLKRPTVEPRATDYITQIIELVKKLEANGLAYVVDGDVFYRVKKFSAYGKLSGKRIDDLLSGARIEIDDRKESPLDFALWKKSKPGEPSWESPWGPGRPGWHIECSAMSQDILGETFDIHGGGKDLVFPHHENEIAQSEGANFFTIRDILQKYHPETLRLFILSSHYRSPIDFSWDNMDAAGAGLTRLYQAAARLQEAVHSAKASEPSAKPAAALLLPELQAAREAFIKAMDDDFNSALAVGQLFEAAKYINRYLDGTPRQSWRRDDLEASMKLFKELGDVLGILAAGPTEFLKSQGDEEELPISEAEIQDLIARRNQARREKQWAVADEIRDRLASMNIILKDSPDGTQWQRKR